MKVSLVLLIAIITWATTLVGCKPKATNTADANTASTNSPVVSTAAGPLPDNGFKAAVTPTDPPERMRAGQVEVITIKVKNTSDVIWFQRGGESNDSADNKFYIAAGNRWLDKEGNLTAETEGHNGIPKTLKPGEETEMALQITAPKTPGDWILDLDMVQEGVAWFGEKGSPTTKIKVTVVK